MLLACEKSQIVNFFLVSKRLPFKQNTGIYGNSRHKAKSKEKRPPFQRESSELAQASLTIFRPRYKKLALSLLVSTNLRL